MTSFLKELLQYFFEAWIEVIGHLAQRALNITPEFNPTYYQYSVVLLSIAFFYMVCYLIHKQIEEYIKIVLLKRENTKLKNKYDENNRS